MSTPPPLPPTSSPSVPIHPPPPKRGWRRLPLWVWLCALVLVVGGLVATVLGTVAASRLVGEGWDLFEEDVRIALERNPTVQERIGSIREIDLDLIATGNSVHPNDFVFNVKGDRGQGRVNARFESIDDGERIEKGTLKMDDGTEWPLAPDPGVDPAH